jgi:hypothetical protein
MSDPTARVLRPGHRIALDQDVYTVIQLNGTTVTLQDQHGELSVMLLGYLLTAPGFAALDAAQPRRAPQDGRLSVLDEAEQQRIRWLEKVISSKSRRDVTLRALPARRTTLTSTAWMNANWQRWPSSGRRARR